MTSKPTSPKPWHRRADPPRNVWFSHNVSMFDAHKFAAITVVERVLR